MAAIEKEKERLREAVWSSLEENRVALFPGARGRIPNFKGAAEAAARLAGTTDWKRARVIKCNPDSPQRPVRLLALREGKVVYMAVPRLRSKKCFWKLDPKRLGKEKLAAASTIRGASELGLPMDPRNLPHLDLIVAGSVAVNRAGARIGKGGGYSDLEYAIGRQVGSVDAKTVVATTVHSVQLLDEELPMTAHDFLLDLIVTPEEVIHPKSRGTQPRGILRGHLTTEQKETVPILRELGF